MRVAKPFAGLPIAAVALVTAASTAHATATPPPCAPSESARAPIASTLDLLDAATYQIETTFLSATGRQVRRSLPAVPNVPIAVDVDGGLIPLPDVLVELRLESPEKASLHIDRMVTAPRRLPLRVEVTADPPTGGGDDVAVAFGYDARAGAEPGTRGDAPRRFTTALDFEIGEQLPEKAGTRSTLEPTVTTETVGDRLDLLAAVSVAGADAQRIAATAQLAPVPEELTLEVVDTCAVAVRTTDAHVDTDAPTTVTGEVTVVDDGVRRDVHARVEQLVDTVDVVAVRELTADRDSITYHASDDVARADLRVDEFAPGSDTDLARQALAKATGVPATGFRVDHDGRGPDDPRIELTALGGPLASVEGGFASGREVELVEDLTPLQQGQDLGGVDPAYADLGEGGAVARVFGLQHALLDLADKGNDGDVRLRLSAESRPVLVRHVAGTRTTVAQALEAPATIEMRFEKPNPLLPGDPLVIEYSGSDPIDRVHATVDDPGGIVDRPGKAAPTSAEITADDVPPCLRIVKQEAGDLVATVAAGVDDRADGCGSGTALGELDARVATATDGSPDEPADDNRLTAGADGISLDDLDDRFALRARLRGLQAVTLSRSEPAAATREETRSELQLVVRTSAAVHRPLEIHADTQEGPSRSRVDYVDLTLARLPAVVDLTLETADRALVTSSTCGDDDFAFNICDTGTAVEFHASETVDPDGDAPALLLDTSAGLRQGPFEATTFVAGNPNTRLELPVLPQRVAFCQSTYTFCGPGPDEREPESQLRIDASQTIPVRLFDCRSRGREDVFDDAATCDADDGEPKREQRSVAAEIEGVRFLEADLQIPAPAADDTGGFIFLNTNPGTPGTFDGEGNAKGHLIRGDGAQDVDHDGIRSPGDVFQLTRSFGVGCPPKPQAMEIQFDDLSADHRLVDFILVGDRCDGVFGTTGVHVTDRSGRIECNRSVFDAAPHIPLIGGLGFEICGFDPS